MSYGGTLHLEIKGGARDEGFPLDLYAGFGMTLERHRDQSGPFFLLGLELIGYGGGYGGDAWFFNTQPPSVPQPLSRR